MSKVEFSKEEKDVIIRKIQLYFKKELDQEVGQFDAEFLLDFFSVEVGSNRRGNLDSLRRILLPNRMQALGWSKPQSSMATPCRLDSDREYIRHPKTPVWIPKWRWLPAIRAERYREFRMMSRPSQKVGNINKPNILE